MSNTGWCWSLLVQLGYSSDVERLRPGWLNLKEKGNVIPTGTKLTEQMVADLIFTKNFFVVPLILFPGRGKVYISGDCVPNSAPHNSFFPKVRGLGHALCPKLGNNMHLGPSLTLNTVCSHSGDSQEQILFQTDFNKTDFLRITSLTFQKSPLTLWK